MDKGGVQGFQFAEELQFGLLVAMDDEDPVAIRNDDLVFTPGTGLESFIGEQRLEDKIIAFFL